jgi:hypothetical protein
MSERGHHGEKLLDNQISYRSTGAAIELGTVSLETFR